MAPMLNQTMDPNATCLKCGAELPGNDRGGFCPRCLFQQANAGLLDSIPAGEATTLAGGTASSPPATPRKLPSASIRPFGDYELLEEIARGGMGVVYKARQVSLDRIVAVKMILTGAAASKEFIHRFRTEAAAAANLQHPNIVAVHEVGAHQGENFMVMDFVEGANLAHHTRQQPLSPPRAARYLKAIAEAIHYAHERGILHRDLKPSNVLIDSASDQPRVTDFGLAKRFSSESQLSAQDSQLTLTGQVLGSPNFMAPEQASGTKGKVSRRTDVYGLGAILYHLLTARPPFQSESLPETLQQVTHTEPLSPRLLNPSVPRDLETICLKCLEKEPEKRYSTGQALADELGRFLKDEPIHARPVSTPEKLSRWCRRKPALAGAVTMAAVLLLIVAIGSPLATLRIAASRDAEKNARQETARNLYAADVKGASVAVEEHDLPRARKLLEDISASTDRRDLRGWEWRYLMGQCRSDELATLGTHDRSVDALAFSPDDKVLASISGDGVVKLWDWALRKESLSWQAHKPVLKHQPKDPTHGLIFLPGTSTLVTSGKDEFVRFWSLGSTTRLSEVSSPGGRSSLLACTRDGRLLATGSGRNQILLWDISDTHSPKLVASLPTKLRYIWAVQFLPDGKSLLVSSGAEIIQWWDISNVRNPTQKKESVPGYLGMAFSPDGRQLVTGGSDSLLRWEVNSTEFKEGRPVPQSRWTDAGLFKLSPDGRSLVSGGGIGNLVFRDMKDERLPVTFKGHDDSTWGLAFTSDGRILASGSLDKTVRLWDVAKIWQDDFSQQPVLRHSSDLRGLGFSPDGKYLASISWEDEQKEKANGLPPATLKLWDAVTRTEIGTVPLRKRERMGGPRVEFSPDGHTLVIEDEGKLHLYTVPELQAVTNWPGFGPAYSPDGSAMVYALANPNRIVRRNLATGQEIRIGEPADGVEDLVLSPDGRTVVTSGSGSGGMTFWDALGQGPPIPVEKHSHRVGRVAFSPDGQTLASTSTDRKLGLWNVKDQRNLALLSGHKGYVVGVAFSPDGRTVASSSQDGTVRLWNLTTRREVAVLRHPRNVFPLAFSPNGQWLVTGGRDPIRFWHAPTLAELDAAQKTKEKRK